jgi:hypothetical protein
MPSSPGIPTPTRRRSGNSFLSEADAGLLTRTYFALSYLRLYPLRLTMD